MKKLDLGRLLSTGDHTMVVGRLDAIEIGCAPEGAAGTTILGGEVCCLSMPPYSVGASIIESEVDGRDIGS